MSCQLSTLLSHSSDTHSSHLHYFLKSRVHWESKLITQTLFQCSNAILPPLLPAMSPFPLSACLCTSSLLSLSGMWKELIKLLVQHLQQSSFSFLRLLQL